MRKSIQSLLVYGCLTGWLLWLPMLLNGQTTATDSIETSEVEVLHADIFELFQEENGDILQKISGTVELRQDSVFMYCDTAIIRNETELIAKGNVIIQQGDSLNVFADSLFYDGELKLAKLEGEVVLVNDDQQLFTEQLVYDLNTKRANYQQGAMLTNGTTQLTSRIGYYYVPEKKAFFKKEVYVIDSLFSLKADTLEYNIDTEQTYFHGPTRITADSSEVYCEDGYYDIGNQTAVFKQNAQYIKGEQIALADEITYNGSAKTYTLSGNAQFTDRDREATADVIQYDETNNKTILSGNAIYKDSEQNIQSDEIIYDSEKEIYSTKGRSTLNNDNQILTANQIDYIKETGLGLAKGDVVWKDTIANLTIKCQEAQYNEATNYIKATGERPLLIALIEEDSLYMTADTLLAIQPDSVTNDSSRILLAYEDVRILKSNLQAVCDSLVFNTMDSVFNLYKNPVIWSDTTQFSADTIQMQLRNKQIDKIYLYDNSFIINSPDELYFNQIKGRDIVAFFRDSELRQMDVNGSAESIYYALDAENAYIGVNKTKSSEMRVYFGDNQVNRITFLAQPEAEMLPMKKTDHQTLRLKGFDWENRQLRRPKLLADLLKMRPTPLE